MYNINNLTFIACIATYTECQVGTREGKANKKIKVREFSTKSWKSLIDMFKIIFSLRSRSQVKKGKNFVNEDKNIGSVESCNLLRAQANVNVHCLFHF